MLMSSPRARLPVGGTSGAAFVMPAIFGVCAEASPAKASRRIPEVGTRLDPGMRMTVFS